MGWERERERGRRRRGEPGRESELAVIVERAGAKILISLGPRTPISFMLFNLCAVRSPASRSVPSVGRRDGCHYAVVAPCDAEDRLPASTRLCWILLGRFRPASPSAVP